MAVSAAQVLIHTFSAALPGLVFEGYSEWYDGEDVWVLRNLGQVLTTREEDEILSGLDQAPRTPSTECSAPSPISGWLSGRTQHARSSLTPTMSPECWKAQPTPRTGRPAALRELSTTLTRRLV